MNASSTTSVRPGRASAASAAAGCSTEVGLVGLPTTTRSASSGHRRRVQPEAVLAARSSTRSHLVPRVPQRRLRLGELRVHHRPAGGPAAPAPAARTPPPRPPSAAPAPSAARAGRHRRPRGPAVGVGGEAGRATRRSAPAATGRRVRPYVDGEVDQRRRRRPVPRRRRGGAGRGCRWRRGDVGSRVAVVSVMPLLRCLEAGAVRSGSPLDRLLYRSITRSSSSGTGPMTPADRTSISGCASAQPSVCCRTRSGRTPENRK